MANRAELLLGRVTFRGRREFVPAWMSDYDVRQIADLRQTRDGMEKSLLALRRRLIAADPSLPNEHDGEAWQPLENEFMDPPMVDVTVFGVSKDYVPGLRDDA